MRSGTVKVALVCSPGGHLDELQRIAASFEKYDLFYLTYESVRTPLNKRAYKVPNILRGPRSFVSGFARTMLVILKERPDAIVTTGAELAIPAFAIGMCIHSRRIFVESLARVRSPSGTGRLLYQFSDLFLVQWPSLAKVYGPRAQYVGGLV